MYAVFLLGMLIIPSLLPAALNSFQGKSLFAEININTDISLVFASLILIYAYLIYFGRSYVGVALQKLQTKTKFLPTLSATIIGLLFALMIYAIMLVVPPPEGFAKAGLNKYLSGTNYSLTLAIVCAVIIAPIMEEYIFRGYIFDGLRQKYSLGFTFVSTSLLFVFPHMLEYFEYWPAAVMLFGLGIILAYFSERYESLAPCIALHASYNLSLVFFSLAMNSP